MRLSALFQGSTQGPKMGFGDLPRTPERPSFPRRAPLTLPCAVPAHGRGPADAAPARNLGLADAFGKQSHALPAAVFHPLKVPASASCLHHGRILPGVTHLGKPQ